MRQPENDAPTRGIAILGSTGSIGTQALDVVRDQRDALHVEVLSAHRNAELLIAQAKEFKPNAVVIGDDAKWKEVNDALFDAGIKVYSGAEALEQVVEVDGIDMVLTAMVGAAGLKPTLRAIDAGKHIALANKETLVVAGEIVMNAARNKGVDIHPVDSEHSAIYQCIAGEFHNAIEKVILTASGGPFRGRTLDSLAGVTKADALKHPNWDMGAKITIDSASLMNKGLEVIEAKWLFDVYARPNRRGRSPPKHRPQLRAIRRRKHQSPARIARHEAAHPIRADVPATFEERFPTLQLHGLPVPDV